MTDREMALREAQAAIRESCGMCDGHGYTLETRYRDGHNCDGTEESCQENCPVAVPDQEQCECEYCGRPIDAIEKLIGAQRPDPSHVTPLPAPSVTLWCETCRDSHGPSGPHIGEMISPDKAELLREIDRQHAAESALSVPPAPSAGVETAKEELRTTLGALFMFAAQHPEVPLAQLEDDYQEDLNALIAAVAADCQSVENKDDSAGLIGQAIPDVDGTLSRPNRSE